MRKGHIPFGISVGVMNDNIRDYIGADDFHSVSYFAHAQWSCYQSSIAMHTLTSRLLDWRYDILEININRAFELKQIIGGIGPDWTYKIGVGFLAQGDFGGEEIQNGWHRIFDLPQVNLPHLDSAAYAPMIQLSLQKRYATIKPSTFWLLSADNRLYYALWPSVSSISLSFSHSLGERLKTEFLAGWRWEYNNEENYSELSDPSSPLFGGLVSFRAWDKLYFQFGLGYRQAKNLLRDPAYKKREISYATQIWTVLSWEPQPESIRRLLGL